jgi:hypothetical protein
MLRPLPAIVASFASAGLLAAAWTIGGWEAGFVTLVAIILGWGGVISFTV